MSNAGVQQRPHAGPLRRAPRARRRRAATPRRRTPTSAIAPDAAAGSSAAPARRCRAGTRRPSRAMSSGGRRWRSSHSAPRSTIRRQSRNSSSWVSSGTCAGRARRSRAHSAGKSKTSRATTHARVTSTTTAPVSSVMRWSNEMPDRLTIWLTTCGGDDLAAQPVADGSPRRSARAAASGSSGRGRPRAAGRRAGRCAPSRRRWRSSCRRSARRTRASCSPTPAAWRSAICLSVGRNSSAAVEPALGLEHVDVAGVHVDHRQRLPAGDRQRQRLGPVVVEHELGDLVGHRRQQLVALLGRQLAGRRRRRRAGS